MKTPPSLTQTRALLTAREISAVELTQAHLDRIGEKNKTLNAYIRLFDDALAHAKEVDDGLRSGPLAGIPFAVKDAILVEGQITSAGSHILENYRAAYDATAVRRLKDAGAVLLGSANMDEFAMGASNETSYFGPVKNPHDMSRVPGGSSGGSACAVAADLAVAALGSDTGGSVRQPAAFCGVVGLRPTYGTVSRFGLIAMASSLDQIGPITRTVEDAETVFSVIAGRDPKDATSRDYVYQPVNTKRSASMTIGVISDLPTDGVDERILANVTAAKEKLAAHGYTFRDISLPSLKYGVSCYYILMPAEASTNLARFDGMRYGLHVDGDGLWGDYAATRGAGFGREVRRRIILGTYVLSAGYYDAYYGQALKARDVITSDFARAFADVDAILMPTTPGPAFHAGEKSKDPIAMYLEDLFTIPSGLAGLPSISVPFGSMAIDGATLPLSVQVVAPAWREDILFSIGKDIEA